VNKDCRLYLITPPKIDLEKFVDDLKQAFAAGDVAVLQLRLKDAPRDEIKKAAETLLPICRGYDVAFIINDDPELAKEVGADGVHVGEEDVSVKEAREILGEGKIVGASCYASKDRAFTAGEQGADYVAFGAFYETKTKEPKGRPDIDLLEFWHEYANIPCVAIGGIKPDNAAPLAKAGADFIAVVTGVWDHAQGPAEAVKEYNKAIK